MVLSSPVYTKHKGVEMKNIAKPVNPLKPLFLSAILILGGCASKPANITLGQKPSGHYWKWVADTKSWDYFDRSGKLVATISDYEGLWAIEQSCVNPTTDENAMNHFGDGTTLWSFNGHSVSFSGDHYDTAQHAEKAVEDYCK